MKTLWINAGEISGDLQGGALLSVALRGGDALIDFDPHGPPVVLTAAPGRQRH